MRKLDPYGESLEHISKYNFSFTTCRPIDATSITKSYVHVLQSIIVDFVPHGIANSCCQITHIIYRQKSLGTRKAKIITFLVSLQITVLYNHSFVSNDFQPLLFFELQVLSYPWRKMHSIQLSYWLHFISFHFVMGRLEIAP